MNPIGIRITDEGVTVMGTEEPGTPLKQDPMRESAERKRQVSIIDQLNTATAFNRELTALLNKYSGEEHSNTPDFILAQYLVTCLSAFNVATREREEWYGVRLVPGQLSGPVQHITKPVEEQDG